MHLASGFIGFLGCARFGRNRGTSHYSNTGDDHLPQHKSHTELQGPKDISKKKHVTEYDSEAKIRACSNGGSAKVPLVLIIEEWISEESDLWLLIRSMSPSRCATHRSPSLQSSICRISALPESLVPRPRSDSKSGFPVIPICGAYEFFLGVRLTDRRLAASFRRCPRGLAFLFHPEKIELLLCRMGGIKYGPRLKYMKRRRKVL